MSTDNQDSKPGLHRQIEIVVNAERHEVSQERMSFEDIVRLAFPAPDFNNSIVYTVTFKRGPHQNREGSLVAGDTVFVTNGMIFNVKRTDRS